MPNNDDDDGMIIYHGYRVDKFLPLAGIYWFFKTVPPKIVFAANKNQFLPVPAKN